MSREKWQRGKRGKEKEDRGRAGREKEEKKGPPGGLSPLSVQTLARVTISQLMVSSPASCPLLNMGYLFGILFPFLCPSPLHMRALSLFLCHNKHFFKKREERGKMTHSAHKFKLFKTFMGALQLQCIFYPVGQQM